jgi:formiminoglutamase
VTQLPLLISIPHGSRERPPELDDVVVLSEADLFDDGDAFAEQLYDVGEAVTHVEAARVARAFVDLNRAEDDLPPANPDGVVKSVTCYEAPIYAEGSEPGPALVETLLARYHRPYHDALRGAAGTRGLLAALDCHTMAEKPPPIAPDHGERPLFCLSDRNGAASPWQLTEALGDALATAFEIPRDSVKRNRPFEGGFIVRTHGADGRAAGNLPWIQVEMNRRLYLAEPWFDRSTLEVDPARLAEVRDRFATALRGFVGDVRAEQATAPPNP